MVLTSVTPHVVPLYVHVSYRYLNDNRVTYLKTVHACVVYTWTFCSHYMHINKHSWCVNTSPPIVAICSVIVRLVACMPDPTRLQSYTYHVYCTRLLDFLVKVISCYVKVHYEKSGNARFLELIVSYIL